MLKKGEPNVPRGAVAGRVHHADAHHQHDNNKLSRRIIEDDQANHVVDNSDGSSSSQLPTASSEMPTKKKAKLPRDEEEYEDLADSVAYDGDDLETLPAAGV